MLIANSGLGEGGKEGGEFQLRYVLVTSELIRVGNFYTLNLGTPIEMGAIN